MLNREQKTIVAVGYCCWGKGKTLQEAAENCRKASGKRGQQRMLVYVFTEGTPEQHEEITVNEHGSVCWPGQDDQGKELKAYKIGHAKIGVTKNA